MYGFAIGIIINNGGEMVFFFNYRNMKTSTTVNVKCLHELTLLRCLLQMSTNSIVLNIFYLFYNK